MAARLSTALRISRRGVLPVVWGVCIVGWGLRSVMAQEAPSPAPLPASALLRTLTGHTSYVYSVAFSPDARTLASGSDDNTIKLWDTASGELLRRLTGHTSSVYSVAFSPDGRTLASGSVAVASATISPDGRILDSGNDNRTIKLWDAASGQLLRTPTGHTDRVRSVAFSPDGRTLAAGDMLVDKTINLWDSASGQLLRTLIGHTESVMSVAFSPDRRTLASGSADKTIKLWDVLNVNEAGK